MSGIAGLFRLDGRPTPPGDLQPLLRAMAPWGPDGVETYNDGPLALAQFRLRVTPESRHERLPLVSPSGDRALVAAARLDNRAELCTTLRTPPAERAAIPDSALILAAYERWGEGCTDHLLGDWAFALWDRPLQQLFLARDHYGVSGLYYYHSPHCFAFATSLHGLMALPEIPRRPNPLRIAQTLLAWPGDMQETCFEGVRFLPPAHRVVITPKGPALHRYWRMEEVPPIRLSSDREYVETFLHLYSEAVRCRLRTESPVGVLLSGGLDSGSVCTLAAQQQAACDRRLMAFTSAPLYADANALVSADRLGDETLYAEATARHIGHRADSMEHRLSRAEEISPLEGIRRFLQIQGEPGPAAGNFYWIIALLAEAQQRGCRTILTGQGGNATISWTSPEPPGSFTLQNWSRCYRSRGAWQAFRSTVLRPLLQPTRLRLQRWQVGREPWRTYSAIQPALVRRLALADRMREEGHDPTFLRPPAADARVARLSTLRPARSQQGSVWHNLGAAHGLEVSDPTLDRRVIDFCLGIPDDQYRRDENRRWLIRRSMEGLLPESVIENARRGQQGADLARRFQAHREETEAALTQIERSALACEYLDVPRMRAVLTQLEGRLTPASTASCNAILARGLIVGLFLESFSP